MLSCSKISLRARLDGIVLCIASIPNYPAKFFWVNLLPFVKVNVHSYLPCGSRLKNEVLTCTFPCVSPPRLLSLMDFEI